MDRYVISGRIGEGAHGVVLKGVDKSTLQVVALKKISLKNIGEQGLPNSVRLLKYIFLDPLASLNQYVP